MSGKYWAEIKKEMDLLKKKKHKYISSKTKEHELQEAIMSIKGFFEEYIKSTEQIPKCKIKQCIVEDLRQEMGYGIGTAVILEWGNKLRLNEEDLSRLTKFRKKKIIRLFKITDIPPKIVKTDYNFICFHINNDFISFPHNPEFESIEVGKFLKNTNVIKPIIEHAIINPQYNNKILIKGIDYWT
ncbi:hypothetical protein KKG52_03685 [Patescibacteria group bacterium]|nr:hypothetical protein [Patescibacteria group bacterium]